MSGVKAIESKTARCHLIEHGSFQIRMTVVAGFLPSMIVAHEQDDVGLATIVISLEWSQSDCRKDEPECCIFHHRSFNQLRALPGDHRITVITSTQEKAQCQVPGSDCVASG